jgi:modulator of FtsH protease
MQPELKPIPANDRILGSSGPSYAPGSALPAASAQKVLRNTQLLLALTMVPTAIGAYFGMATGGIIQQYPIVSFFVMLGATIGLQFAIVANRNSSLGVVFLLLMTGLLGWFIGPLLNYALALKNGAQLVGYAAGGTALVFFVMATVASVTKRDFSFMGKFLFVGMIALLLAMVANMFLQIPALALTISTLVIVVFSLFLLHDLSRIVTGGETNYIMAATGVYMSLFNIFVNLLQILMALSGERD